MKALSCLVTQGDRFSEKWRFHFSNFFVTFGPVFNVFRVLQTLQTPSCVRTWDNLQTPNLFHIKEYIATMIILQKYLCLHHLLPPPYFWKSMSYMLKSCISQIVKSLGVGVENCYFFNVSPYFSTLFSPTSFHIKLNESKMMFVLRS